MKGRDAAVSPTLKVMSHFTPLEVTRAIDQGVAA